MSWYNDNNIELDYNKPIKATDGNMVMLLMPVLKCPGSYEVIGYNWFIVKSGHFNSSCTFPTARQAVTDYMPSYEISNTEITLS